jgi:hypothetical protein
MLALIAASAEPKPEDIGDTWDPAENGQANGNYDFSATALKQKCSKRRQEDCCKDDNERRDIMVFTALLCIACDWFWMCERPCHLWCIAAQNGICRSSLVQAHLEVQSDRKGTSNRA